jgi:tetratricopeptide (TPR) repeat protein
MPSLEDKFSLKFAQHYAKKLRELGNQYDQHGDQLNNALQTFDADQGQLWHAQAWTATNRQTNVNAALLCLDIGTCAPNLMAHRLVPYDRLNWLEAGLDALNYLPQPFPDHQAKLLTEIGNVRMSIGQYEEANAALQEALALVTIHRMDDQRVSVEHLLEHMALLLGNLSTVLNSEQPTSTSQLFNQASALMLKQRYKEAAALFERLLTITDNPHNEISALNMLANVYYEMGNGERTLEYARRALALARQYRIQDQIAQSLNTVGVALFANKKYSESLPHFLEAVEIEITLNNPRGIAESYQNVGNIYFTQSDYATAIDYFQKARALYMEMELTHLIRGVDRLIGQCHLQTHPITQILALNPMNRVVSPIVHPLTHRIRLIWRWIQERKDYK